MKSLAVVIPAYNEEKNVEIAVKKCIEACEKLQSDFEIILVNDASKDSTKDIIDNIGFDNKRIKIFHHVKNKGIGGALKTGFHYATKEYAICSPVDSPITYEETKKFLSEAKDADIVISYRIKREGYTPIMLLSSWFYLLCLRILFGLKFRDVNWIHLYKLSLFKKNGIEINYDGIFMLAEILIKAKWKKLKFVEIPTRMERRIYGKPSASNPKVILKTIRDMLHFRFITLFKI